MRHYLNLRILWSVWNEYDLIPEQWRSWTSPKGWWVFYGFGSGAIPAWMKCVTLHNFFNLVSVLTTGA